MHQLMHWQKEAVMALDHTAMWEWLGAELKNRVPEKSQELFVEMMRQNILFPSEAKKWVDILFANDLTFSDEYAEILKTAGGDFFVAAEHAVKQHDADLKTILQELKTTLNVSGKNLFMPIRIALTGEPHGPELAQIAILLGADKMRERFLSVQALVKK